LLIFNQNRCIPGQRSEEAFENAQISPEPDQFWDSQVVLVLSNASAFIIQKNLQNFIFII
jgi:hypothetical protein